FSQNTPIMLRASPRPLSTSGTAIRTEALTEFVEPQAKRYPKYRIFFSEKPMFVMSKYGNRMLKIGENIFILHKASSRGPKKRWVCRRHFVYVYAQTYQLFSGEAEFVVSQYGNKMIKMGRFRFRIHKPSSRGLKCRWVCSRERGGCRATLITYDDNIVI
ncbi:hypothetical protein ACJJTC_009956, partial [Scirpophaga incertulas]